MREDLILQQFPPVSEPSPQDAARARKVVCANAVNADEAKTLLDMLGLL